MQAFLVLVVLGWLISLPWAAIFLWLLGLLIVGLVLFGVAVHVMKSRQQAYRSGPPIDAEYLAALESLLAHAEAEARMLRAEIAELQTLSPAAPRTQVAALHGRVGLSETAPAWLVNSARRAYRSQLHPDRHPPHRKDEAERRYKQAEHVFDQIAALRGR